MLKEFRTKVLFYSPQGNIVPYFQMSPIDPSICWNDLSWFQSITRLPIILKGILTKEDAELAVKHNVQGIIVSNHGGRQLDEVPASVSRLTSGGSFCGCCVCVCVSTARCSGQFNVESPLLTYADTRLGILKTFNY